MMSDRDQEVLGMAVKRGREEVEFRRQRQADSGPLKKVGKRPRTETGLCRKRRQRAREGEKN
jgi:hypothetical protein